MIALTGLLLTAGTAFAQSQPAGPVIAGVVDSASYSANIAWGELVSIFGANLSDGGTYQAQILPLPTQLGTTQVFSGTEALQLVYVSPTQINLLMSTASPPQNCQGVGGQCVNLTVQVGGLTSAGWNNGYSLYAPALFSSGFDCPYLGWPNAAATNVPCGLSFTQKPGQFPRPIVTDLNYALVTNNNPAHLGQPYVLWLTGLGNPGYTGDLRFAIPDSPFGVVALLPSRLSRWACGRRKRSLRRRRRRISWSVPIELYVAIPFKFLHWSRNDLRQRTED